MNKEVSLEPLMVDDVSSSCDGIVRERFGGRLQRIEPAADAMAVTEVIEAAVAMIVETAMSGRAGMQHEPSAAGDVVRSGHDKVWERIAIGGRLQRIEPAVVAMVEAVVATAAGVWQRPAAARAGLQRGAAARRHTHRCQRSVAARRRRGRWRVRPASSGISQRSAAARRRRGRWRVRPVTPGISWQRSGLQRVTSAKRWMHRGQRSATVRRRRGRWRVRLVAIGIREPRTAVVVGVG